MALLTRKVSKLLRNVPLVWRLRVGGGEVGSRSCLMENKLQCFISQFTGNKISISHLWHLKSYTQSTFLLDVSIIGPLLVLHATKIKQFLVLHMTEGATLLHHNLIRFTLARSLCHIQKAFRLHNSLMKSHLLFLYLLKSHF